MESNQKLGQEPAFPPTKEVQELDQNCYGYHVGMSKRFYAACAAMQGYIIRGHDSISSFDRELLIKRSYVLADELLKQENGE